MTEALRAYLPSLTWEPVADSNRRPAVYKKYGLMHYVR